jgi:uncharacterized protein YjiS (DUF1127 family)
MSAALADAGNGCARKCAQGGCPKFASCLRRMLAAQRTRNELAALDDVGLKDIGLYRGDIEAVALENWR